MDRAGPIGGNDGGVSKGFYTVSEAAKVLGVGQRRVLEMLETREIKGERDPISSRWKVSKHAVHELAPEEPADTAGSPSTKEDTVELRVAEGTQATHETADSEEPLLASQLPPEDSMEGFSEQFAEEARERIGELKRTNDRLQVEHQAEKAAWQEEKQSLLAAADRERQHAEALQEEVGRLRTELRTSQERISELKRLNEHLQLEQEAERATWQEEKEALLAAANRELQNTEALKKEVARLSTELEANRGLTSRLERSNERLRLEQQTEKAAWEEEKETLLDAVDRERRHSEELQGEVERLSAELETERSKPSWRRLFG